MPEIPVEYPEIDFATDAVPNLHEILRDLRERHAVAPVRYHGATAYLITRFGDLRSAMADDESFPSWAAPSSVWEATSTVAIAAWSRRPSAPA